MRRSALELLLPSGSADRALVLGSACPPRLLPSAEADPGAGPIALVIVAPTEAECRMAGWLERTARTCAEGLAADGIAYVLMPPRFRAGFQRQLGSLGVSIGPAVLHLPDVAESRDLVPLEPRAARFALEEVVPVQAWKRRAAAVLLALGAGRVLAARDARVALIARRGTGRPLFDWLGSPGADAPATGDVIVSLGWRAAGGRVVLHPVPHGAETGAVVKVSLDPIRETLAERELLAVLAPAARRAGVAVPTPLPSPQLPGAKVVAQTRVPGELVAPALMRRPARLGAILASVSAWLEEWHRQTAVVVEGVGERLEREILTPLEALAPRLTACDQYVATMRARCAAVASGQAPLAAAHNDLTMWNLLIDRNGRLGVVDWESAEEAALPLKDFFYAVVDGVAATGVYADRLAAARECFEAGGEHAATIGGLQDALARAVGASPEWVALSFDACWLGHAANELRSAGPDDPTPFREIAQWLVDRAPQS